MKSRILLFVLLAISVLLLAGCPRKQTITPQNTDTETTDQDTQTEQPDEPIPEIVETQVLNRNDLMRIGNNLGVELSEGENVFYDVDGVRVQCNWLKPSDSNNLIPLFNALFAQVGTINAILLGPDRVYEIRNVSPYAGNKIKETLELAPIQEIKLTPFSIYGEGEIITEESGGRDELGKVDVSIFQIIKTSDTEIALSYALPGQGFDKQEWAGNFAEFTVDPANQFEINQYSITVISDNPKDGEFIQRLLTVPPTNPNRPAHFNVTFKVAPVAILNYMKMNDCSNMAVSGLGGSEIEEVDPSIKFGSSLQIFTNGDNTQIESEPECNINNIDDSVARMEIHFERGQGMKIAEITMDSRTGNPLTEGPANPEEYLEATVWWPIESMTVERELDNALGDASTPREKAIALHDWVRKVVRFGGPITGSRYGFESVLGQGYGHCWDLSDVFITMARAAGLPSRQIAGWIYGSEGHVWSQVWLEDEEIWLDVDTTADDVGVNSYYVPIWGTIDGEMPFIYTQWPRIERVGG